LSLEEACISAEELPVRLCVLWIIGPIYRGADKSLARPGRKQSTVTEDFEFHIAYL